ncbi:HNH/ENDO VII family nuclease [Mycobacterium asiaticum]|nr:HNH/ENDO VII family nuclease [Mycobacterium asiaticum]
MAGSDKPGRKFSQGFDPALGGRGGEYGGMESATDTINGSAAIIDLISATVVNHAQGDAQSAFEPQDSDLAFGPLGKATFLCPNVPKAYGGDDSNPPTGWSLVVNYLEGEVWPNGNPGKLRQAAAALRGCAHAFNSRQSLVDTAVGAFRAHTSPDLAVAADKIGEMKGQLADVGATMTDLANACDSYAQKIDDAHKQIIDALKELLAWTIAIEAVAGIAAFFTVGIAEIPGQVIEVARVVATASRILEIIRALAAAVESMGTIGPAMMRVAAGGTRMRALMEAPVLLATFEGKMASIREAMAAASRNQYTRPTLRESTKQIVRGATRVEEHGGVKYYVSATDENVLIPVSGAYPESVSKLPIQSNPKSGKPEYYVDAATGFKYPVNPTAQFGHRPGQEYWRLRDQAIGEGWTRKQFIDEFNQPKHFQIEDAPGNQSHRFEVPRAR